MYNQLIAWEDRIVSNILEILLNIVSFIMLKTTAKERNFYSIFHCKWRSPHLLSPNKQWTDIYPIPQTCSQRTQPFDISIVVGNIQRLSEVLNNQFGASLLQLIQICPSAPFEWSLLATRNTGSFCFFQQIEVIYVFLRYFSYKEVNIYRLNAVSLSLWNKIWFIILHIVQNCYWILKNKSSKEYISRHKFFFLMLLYLF